jgi:hypothetical protein
MLNLRTFDESSESHVDGCETTRRITLRFDTSVIVGNMGESLQFGEQNYENDLEDASEVSTPSDHGFVNGIAVGPGV